MTPRPATQNKRDAIKARKLLSQAFQLQDEAWHLLQAIERREGEQHASYGPTDKSVAKRRKRGKR